MARVLEHHSGEPQAKTLDDGAISAAYREYRAWGMETAIDLSSCDSLLIRDAAAIRRFVRELCGRIKMKRFGPCRVVNFGEDERVAGFSMTQLIETSLISGHFANQTSAVYLNVFSCCPYNPWVVAEFAKEFFKASSYTYVCTLRKAERKRGTYGQRRPAAQDEPQPLAA